MVAEVCFSPGRALVAGSHPASAALPGLYTATRLSQGSRPGLLTIAPLGLIRRNFRKSGLAGTGHKLGLSTQHSALFIEAYVGHRSLEPAHPTDAAAL